MATPKVSRAELAEYADDLRELLPPGSTCYTVVKHVSSSGMQREISLYAVHDGTIMCLDYRAAALLDWRLGDRGIKVKGAGMDMAFHTVYTLSSILYRDGFECTGKGCPSNDHSNGDRDYAPHHHADGGYAISKASI